MPARRTKPKASHIPDFKSVVRDMRPVANEATFVAVKAYAESEREMFVRRIEHQDFVAFKKIFYPESGTNLSPEWLEQKAAKGRDLRTMIATTWYIRNIKVWTRKARRKGERTLVKVGFHPRTRARDLDMRITETPLWLVAVYNEYGSLAGGGHPRPHWGPHFNRMHGRARATRKLIRVRVQKALRKALKSRIVISQSKADVPTTRAAPLVRKR